MVARFVDGPSSVRPLCLCSSKSKQDHFLECCMIWSINLPLAGIGLVLRGLILFGLLLSRSIHCAPFLSWPVPAYFCHSRLPSAAPRLKCPALVVAPFHSHFLPLLCLHLPNNLCSNVCPLLPNQMNTPNRPLLPRGPFSHAIFLTGVPSPKHELCLPSFHFVPPQLRGLQKSNPRSPHPIYSSLTPPTNSWPCKDQC